jgi:membrane dipeptidase
VGQDAVIKADMNAPVVVTERARRLHDQAILVDGHNDLPWNIREMASSTFEKMDISQSTKESMHTDIPRLREGGVKAQFWSVFVPASTRHDGKSLETTLEQIDLVYAMIERYPETFALALTTDDIKQAVQDGKIASLIGMEGGHSIENSLAVLRQLYERGARYMTLAHSETLDWCDSATDEAKCGGLSEFGKEVVREMNRLGMLVDISHVSDDAMKETLSVSKAPVIFSHSSARAIADHPRNVPDDVLQLTADNGGVVMVNFYSGYIVPAAAVVGKQGSEYRQSLKQKYPDDEEKQRIEMRRWYNEHPTEPGTIHHVLDHIEHIAKVAGIDHVGLGSDFDGIPTLPKQLEDVSTYPNLTQGMLDRGFSEEEVLKVLGGNLMRVMERAEQVAQELKSQ